MIYLPDVNAWLALAFESHVHHSIAKLWFDAVALSDRCDFCRATQQGFLRLATNLRAFGDEAANLIEAWQLFDAFQLDARIGFVLEPSGIEVYWRDYTAKRTFSPKVWNDAYLAAFSRSCAGTVVTFDKALSQYAGIASELLK